MNEIDLRQAWFALKNELSRYGIMESSVMTKFNVLTQKAEPITVGDILGMIEMIEEEETYDKEFTSYLDIDWNCVAMLIEHYGVERAKIHLDEFIKNALTKCVVANIKDYQNTYKVFTIKEELSHAELAKALRYDPVHLEALREFKPYKVKVILQIKEDKSN